MRIIENKPGYYFSQIKIRKHSEEYNTMSKYFVFNAFIIIYPTWCCMKFLFEYSENISTKFFNIYFSAEKISIGFDNENNEHILFWRAQIDMDDDEIYLTKRFLDR